MGNAHHTLAKIMKIFNPFVTKFAGLLGAGLVRRWLSTMEFKGVYYDPAVDPVNSAAPDRRIFVFWHEHILLLLYLRGHCNSSFLLSRHGDAEVLSRMAYYMGFGTVRGSTGRSGARALRELTNTRRAANLAITPDGPLGPRRQLAVGPIYVASKLGLPIVPVGLGCDRPWRMNTWDNFAIPRPGSRGRLVVGPAIHIPADLDRDSLESRRVGVEQLLNRLTLEAEAWAEHGGPKEGEISLRREPAAKGPTLAAPLKIWTPELPTDRKQAA